MADIQTNLTALRVKDSAAFDNFVECVGDAKRALEIIETGGVQPFRFSLDPAGSASTAAESIQTRHASLSYFSAMGAKMIPVFAQLNAAVLGTLRKELPGFNSELPPERGTLPPEQSQIYRIFVANRTLLGFMGDLPTRLVSAKTLADAGDSLPLELISNESRCLENLWFALDDFLKAAATLQGENMPANFRKT